MTPTDPTGLGPDHIRRFVEDGLVRLDDAFPADLAATCRAALFTGTGIDPDDPATWPGPVHRIGFRSDPCFRQTANTAPLHRAYDQLAGAGRWIAPAGLGTFPIRFPSVEDPPDAGWHVDASFGTEAPDFLDWRVNVTSRGRALLMLFLFSDTGPDDAPTRVRVGSHKAIARELLAKGADGATLRDLMATDWGGTSDCEERLATGAAGTVWLCHPFLVHSAQPLRGSRPRVMAQPPLVPSGEFDPALPPSPVQLAIREACGLVT